MPIVKITQEQHTEIVKRYLNDHESVASLARAFDVQWQTIHEILKKYNVPTMNYAVTPDREEEIIKRYTAGATTRELATDFGVDHSTINRTLRRAGTPLRAKGRRPKFASREEWNTFPAVRIRRLLLHIRDYAKKTGTFFHPEVITHFENDPPKFCPNCGNTFDYTIKHRGEKLGANTPTFRRTDKNDGFTIANTEVVCRSCDQVLNRE